MGQSISDLRKSYERAELDEVRSHADPLRQFGQWMDEAIAAERGVYQLCGSLSS